MINSVNIFDSTPEIDYDVRVTDIFDLDEIQRMQNLFADATGVASIITYPNGTPITKPSNFCKLCEKIIRNTESGCINCFQSDAIIGSHNLVGPTLQRCTSGGLCHAGVSITVGNKHIANWLIGQVKNEDVNEECLVRYTERIGADKTEFINAFDEVPVMSVDRLKKIADMLFVYANELSDRIYKNLQMKRQIEKQAKTNELLHKSEKFLNETQIIAFIGNGSYDFISGVWKNSEILNSILGLKPNDQKSMDQLLQIIHPDWREQLINQFRIDFTQNRHKFNREFVVIRQSDKAERWLHAIGEIQFGKNKEPLKLIVTVQDITERKKISIALRESEELYHSILNASPDAIVIVDMDGKIRMASPATLPMYGCEREEDLLEQNMFDFISQGDKERAIKNTELMFNGYMGTINYQIKKADGNSFFAEVNGDIIWDQNNQPARMIFIIRDITNRKMAESALESSQEQLKKFASHLQNVREEERILLAREIHDELGQILIAMKIELGMMKQKTLKLIKKTDPENILINFDTLFELVDKTIKTTKKIMTDLRPEVLYLLGFIEAVKLQVHNFQERHSINCYFDCSVPKLNLNIQQSVALFRIVQESLTNIAKHSKATSSKILIFKEDDKLILEISDNGIGIKEPHKAKHGSYGLIGMKERMFLLDGELTISGQPDKGTKIKIEMPYILNNDQ